MNGLNGQSLSGVPIVKTRERGFFRDRSEKDERIPAAELTDSGKKQHESAAYSQELLVKLRIFVYNSSI